ncbi:hypothetical protein [Pseudomonas sp. BMS12]|uniref:hypothetical protein n=1 Tax=Pseudomonas sp. BMS12 TaxID=1796033 RepID=UPI00083AC075|nr:hypothetical protein [Pseudomonas sp. BMS12]
MTTINSTSPLATYLASVSKSAASSSSSAEENTNSDPIAELRRLASQMVARSEGGLLRALNSSNQSSSTSALASDRVGQSSGQGSSGTQIQLPDVSVMDRDDAAKLLVQVDKLIDAGLGDSGSFVGFNDGQQTDSLATYRDWLQEKGGISVYV